MARHPLERIEISEERQTKEITTTPHASQFESVLHLKKCIESWCKYSYFYIFATLIDSVFEKAGYKC